MTDPQPPQHAEQPPQRKLSTAARAVLVAAGVIAVLVAGAAIGASVADDDSKPTASATTVGQPAAPEPPSVAPSSPMFRPAQVGHAFELGHWRISVTSIKCASAHELLAENDDNGQEPGDRVCVAALSYTNIDKAPHTFGGTADEPAPESEQLGFAGEAAYTGHAWLQETVNPGLTQTNELIFKVAAGVSLDSVQIGDVLVKA